MRGALMLVLAMVATSNASRGWESVDRDASMFDQEPQRFEPIPAPAEQKLAYLPNLCTVNEVNWLADNVTTFCGCSLTGTGNGGCLQATPGTGGNPNRVFCPSTPACQYAIGNLTACVNTTRPDVNTFIEAWPQQIENCFCQNVDLTIVQNACNCDSTACLTPSIVCNPQGACKTAGFELLTCNAQPQLSLVIPGIAAAFPIYESVLQSCNSSSSSAVAAAANLQSSPPSLMLLAALMTLAAAGLSLQDH